MTWFRMTPQQVQDDKLCKMTFINYDVNIIPMDTRFNPKETEAKIYKMWEEGGYFTPKIDKKKKPFTIVLPLPNASGRMHTGNILMIAIEDIMIRWHRMK